MGVCWRKVIGHNKLTSYNRDAARLPPESAPTCVLAAVQYYLSVSGIKVIAINRPMRQTDRCNINSINKSHNNDQNARAPLDSLASSPVDNWHDIAT